MSKSVKIKRNTKLYRKRRKIPPWLIFALVVLLAVVLGFFGAQAISKGLEKSREESSGVSDEVSSLPSGGETSEETSEENSGENSEEEEIPAAEEMRGQVMPLATMQDESQYQAFFEEVKKNGNNTVILELKDRNGYLYYQTSNQMAISAEAVAQGAVDLASLCTAITDAELIPAVRIYTLRDPLAASLVNETTYFYNNQTNVAWLDDSLDNGGKRWLNPYQENTRNYIADLTKEMAKAGCKKIILKEMQYPLNQYAMGVGNEYDSRINVLKQLYEEVKAGVSAYGAEVWTEFYAESYLGVNEHYYGASPALIGSDKVVLNIRVPVLQQHSDLEAFAGIDVYSNPEQAVDAVLKEVTSDGVVIAAEIESQVPLDLDDVYTENKISNFVQGNSLF